MEKRKWILLCFLATTMQLVAQTEERKILTIEDMFELANQNSRSIKSAQIAQSEAQQAIKVAKSAWLPSVNVSASVSYLGDAWISDRNFSNGMNAPMPHFGNNFAIEASQVIYAGGSITNGIAMAELSHQLAILDTEKNKQDVRFLLIGNYLEMYKLRNQVKVYQQNIEQTKRLITDMHAKQQQGLVLKNDITRYELQLKTLELVLLQIQNSITIQNTQLITTLGLPQNISIEADTTLLDKLPYLTDEQYWQNTATGVSPLLQQAKLGIRQSQHHEKIVRAERLPSIVLFAGDNLDGPIVIEVPPLNQNLNYWYVGVGVKYEISSLFKTNKKIRQAKLSTQKAEENNLLLQENVFVAVKDAYIRFQESFQIYETQLKSLELAIQNYSVVNNRFLNDLSLITDMLDASNAKLSAELQTVNARINILFNYFRLKKSVGDL